MNTSNGITAGANRPVDRHLLLRSILVLSLLAGFVLSSMATAFAEANTNASCMGHEVSSISPPGSSTEFPGGARQLKEVIDTYPVPPGVVYSTIAGLHEGSHEACDAALE